MENQYCKVGAVTPLNNGSQAVHVLEYQYQNFLERASSMNDAKLVEYFEIKAQKIKNILESFV